MRKSRFLDCNFFTAVSLFSNMCGSYAYCLGFLSTALSLNGHYWVKTGLWGLFYYREIPGAMNMIGFLVSSCVVFVGILLMGSEHKD